jgi:hypothetical protein
MTDDELLERFTPPEHLLGHLAAEVDVALQGIAASGITGKKGLMIQLDMTKVSQAVLMTASNHGRRKLGLPAFPDAQTFWRYQQLRNAGPNTEA